LIPSIFALMGRKAFWPFIPKVETTQKKQNRLWTKISKLVKKRAGILAGSLIIIFAIGAFNFTTINFSFNLLKSFPDDMSSRVGFELLEENYPVGELAPSNIIFESKDRIEVNDQFKDEVIQIIEKINVLDGVESVSPAPEDFDAEELPRDFLSESENAIKLQMVLENHPYESDAIETIEELRDL